MKTNLDLVLKLCQDQFSMLNHQYFMSKLELFFSHWKTNLDLVLKKCTSTSGSIFKTKSMFFQRSVAAGCVQINYFNYETA